MVTDNVAEATVMLSDCDAVAPELSRTCTVKLEVPGAVGVPLIAPLADSDTPAGSEPPLTENVYPPVPPVAVSCWE